VPQLHEREAVEAEDGDPITPLHPELSAERRSQPPHTIEMFRERDHLARLPVDDGGI
jgi:hypothetical protein